MFLAADVEVHRHESVSPVPVKGGRGVVGVGVAQVIPGRVNERVHRVGLPSRTATTPTGVRRKGSVMVKVYLSFMGGKCDLETILNEDNYFCYMLGNVKYRAPYRHFASK